MSAVLVIDTASPAFAVALKDGDSPAMTLTSSSEFNHAALLASVEEQLRGAPLEAVIAVLGPGSYSGLRVGIATAQGLALAQDCALAGLSTLEAVAAAVETASARGEARAPVMAIHPAGRGELAVQTFHGFVAVGPLETCAADEPPGSGLAGEGAGPLGGIEIGPGERVAAALGRYLAGALPVVEELAPIYLREPHITQPRRPYGAAGAEGRAPAG